MIYEDYNYTRLAIVSAGFTKKRDGKTFFLSLHMILFVCLFACLFRMNLCLSTFIVFAKDRTSHLDLSQTSLKYLRSIL